MINSLQLKNVATYDQTGVSLADLKKINFVYGVNGSGKTTLTKLVSSPGETNFKHSSVVWKNGVSLKALVYNKEFRDKNFGLGKMDGVFTLGQATKEETELIEQKVAERKALREDLTKRSESLEKQKEIKFNRDNAFKETVWLDIYKKHENEFKEAFVGYMQKENFKKNILVEFTYTSTPVRTYDELKEKAATIFGKQPVSIALLNQLNYTRIIELETEEIWQKKIIGKADVDIAKLIQRLNINDWVNQGRKYIGDDETCPFCQEKTVSPDFKEQLADYFDESYIADTNAVKNFVEEYNRLAANLVHLLQQVESSEKANQSSKLNKETFAAFVKTFSTQVITNQELLNNKIKEPSRSIQLVSVKEQLDSIANLIKTANLEIDKHNLIVANFAKEKQNLVKNVWRYLTDAHKGIIQAFVTDQDTLTKTINGIEAGVTEANRRLTSLSNDIRERSKNVTSVQPSIDQINKTLAAYGFRNFSIVPFKAEANKYQIQRSDGTIADATMSEGEVTFITFLYFLQLSKGGTSENNISEERVLVIDDPICSLDSNVLFVVSSLLKDIMTNIREDKGNIRQLILLTHNVYFHKEVSFIDGRTKHCKDTAYWMLRKNNNITTVQSFGLKNPIQNSYELLWEELKNRANSSGISIQNTMRRIIENYFRMLGKYGDDHIIKKFESQEEQEVCRSLICWINEGSHTIPEDIFVEHQADTIERYFAVFEKIFEHMNHKEHFNMMMGVSAA